MGSASTLLGRVFVGVAGQHTSLTDPNGAERTWGYDDGGRQTTAIDAENRTTSFVFDAVGRQIATTDARGVTISNSFDDAGQLTAQVSPNEIRSFSYGGAGRRTAWTDASGSTTVAFDDVGRMTEIVTPAWAVGYGYNAAGEQTTLTQPEGTVTTNYDLNGFVDTVTDWRGDTITMTNDADGRMVDVARSNGVDSVYGYDTAGRLNNIAHANGAAIIDEFAYTLDGNGNRTAVTSNAGTESYVLDGLNRITAATYPGALTEAFSYDAAGNRTSHTDIDGATVGYTVDATGQLISDTTGTTYTYDQAGNLTGTSDGDAYTYDDYGRATSITAGGVTETYGYDAADVRVAVNGVTQLWDRNGLPTLISTSAGDNYVHANGVARDGNDWLLADAIGSVRASVDQAGVVSAETAFTAYGEPLTGDADTFGFAGEQHDPTGLQHLRARQYKPSVGRFTTVDPVQPGAPGTTGYNLYAYSGNNPTTFTDPSGRVAVINDSSARTSVAGRVAGTLSRNRFVIGVFATAYAGIECTLERGPFGGVGDFFPGICDGFGLSSDGDASASPEVSLPVNPQQALADAYGVDPADVQHCLANFRTFPRACDGIPGGLLRELLGDQNGTLNLVDGNGFGNEGSLANDGTLTLFIRRNGETPQGNEMFTQIVEFFGTENIEQIRGEWLDIRGISDNYDEYQLNIESGLTPEEAALATFTGRQAVRHGFTRVRSIVETEGEVSVIFVR